MASVLNGSSLKPPVLKNLKFLIQLDSDDVDITELLKITTNVVETLKLSDNQHTEVVKRELRVLDTDGNRHSSYSLSLSIVF